MKKFLFILFLALFMISLVSAKPEVNEGSECDNLDNAIICFYYSTFVNEVITPSEKDIINLNSAVF